ncbi:hypothetical protein P168DRAFT_291021 [Aspergillus campestris IBT 28561]|uniref:Uncharacterized protein n=1 Tax=Aspergillus campestris (strain IBT 28561) TaxID=1392248 RepID=A0A2I1D228_ASPC2|nr:uncharacterized protein P168DRAFT_291021 [Aspergillus campestris IBT 28561]PKY03934.1 hypothetical protein P168DRAFT_291021 [Aspergillus campestris IBT 28561]
MDGYLDLHIGLGQAGRHTIVNFLDGLGGMDGVFLVYHVMLSTFVIFRSGCTILQ